MTASEIEAAVATDPNAFFPDAAWYAEATLVIPERKQQLTLRLDAEIVAHFRAQGPRWQTRINAVLKRYVAAQKPK